RANPRGSPACPGSGGRRFGADAWGAPRWRRSAAAYSPFTVSRDGSRLNHPHRFSAWASPPWGRSARPGAGHAALAARSARPRAGHAQVPATPPSRRAPPAEALAARPIRAAPGAGILCPTDGQRRGRARAGSGSPNSCNDHRYARARAPAHALHLAARRRSPAPSLRKEPEERKRWNRSEEHTSELQSRENLVCRLLLEKKKKRIYRTA